MTAYQKNTKIAFFSKVNQKILKECEVFYYLLGNIFEFKCGHPD